jgi:hypothetical protein
MARSARSERSERSNQTWVGSVRVPAPRVADALTRHWDAI